MILADDSFLSEATQWILLVAFVGMLLIVFPLLGFFVKMRFKKVSLELQQAREDAEYETDRKAHLKRDSDKSRQQIWSIVERLDKDLKEGRELYEKAAEDRKDLQKKYEDLYLKYIESTQYHRECQEKNRELEERIFELECRQ